MVSNYCLRVRIHPRDTKDNYKYLKNIEFVPSNESLSTSIVNSYLVVTRTSSVALDAIANDVPYFYVLLSSYDEKISTELTYCMPKELRVTSLEDFICLIQKLENNQLDTKGILKNYSLSNIAKPFEISKLISFFGLAIE